MRQLTQTYKKADPQTLTLHPANPNHGDYGAIHTSITTNGFYGAVIVHKQTGHVIAGNHRVKVARDAGAKTIPIIEVDCDDQTATRIMLADNRTTRLGTDDTDTLANLLRDLDNRDGITGTGYDHDDLSDLLAQFDTPDTPDEAPSTPRPTECPNCGHTFTPGKDS